MRAVRRAVAFGRAPHLLAPLRLSAVNGGADGHEQSKAGDFGEARMLRLDRAALARRHPGVVRVHQIAAPQKKLARLETNGHQIVLAGKNGEPLAAVPRKLVDDVAGHEDGAVLARHESKLALNRIRNFEPVLLHLLDQLVRGTPNRHVHMRLERRSLDRLHGTRKRHRIDRAAAVCDTKMLEGKQTEQTRDTNTHPCRSRDCAKETPSRSCARPRSFKENGVSNARTAKVKGSTRPHSLLAAGEAVILDNAAAVGAGNAVITPILVDGVKVTDGPQRNLECVRDADARHDGVAVRMQIVDHASAVVIGDGEGRVQKRGDLPLLSGGEGGLRARAMPQQIDRVVKDAPPPFDVVRAFRAAGRDTQRNEHVGKHRARLLESQKGAVAKHVGDNFRRRLAAAGIHVSYRDVRLHAEQHDLPKVRGDNA